MEEKNRTIKSWIPLLLLLVVVWLIQSSPSASETYATKVYPYIAAGLSAFSYLFPFSVGDWFIVTSVAGMLIYVIVAVCKRFSFWRTSFRLAIFLGYVYVWFYLAWGLNYFRVNFYTRADIPYVSFNQEDFHSFLTDYIDQLNDTYIAVGHIDTLQVEQEVKKGYNEIASSFGLVSPEKILKSKPMLSSRFMSAVGVLGYMQPFFSEFCLNKELLPVQYAASYAHELAHRLSIAEEAEANLYAYLVCTRSVVPEIRFCGYFSLFSYVLNNAAYVLPEEEFKAVMESVRPEVVELYKTKSKYWSEKYSPLIGEVQHKIYNMFLKGNNIASGTGNYSEVVEMLISYQKSLPEVRKDAILVQVTGRVSD